MRGEAPRSAFDPGPFCPTLLHPHCTRLYTVGQSPFLSRGTRGGEFFFIPPYYYSYIIIAVSRFVLTDRQWQRRRGSSILSEDGRSPDPPRPPLPLPRGLFFQSDAGLSIPTTRYSSMRETPTPEIIHPQRGRKAGVRALRVAFTRQTYIRLCELHRQYENLPSERRQCNIRCFKCLHYFSLFFVIYCNILDSPSIPLFYLAPAAGGPSSQNRIMNHH